MTNLATNIIEEIKMQETQTTTLHASFHQSFQDDIARNAATYGLDHPAVAESQNALGLFYHHVSHEPEKALSCHVKALKIYKYITSSLSSKQHDHRLQKEDEHTIIDMGITITDIGNVQWARGDYKKAMWAFEDSLAVFIWAGLDNNHPRIVSTLSRLYLLLYSSSERAIDNILIQGTVCGRQDDNHFREVSTQRKLNLLLDSFRERAKCIGSLAMIDETDKIFIESNEYGRHSCPMDRYGS